MLRKTTSERNNPISRKAKRLQSPKNLGAA
jgi:hypothetical protein